MNGNVIRTITIRGTSEGLDKVTADLNKLASAQENVAVVSEQSAKRVLSLEDAWKRQTMRLDEAARAQANIARETKIADQALKEGLATQAQHAQRLDQINQRYSTTAKTTAEFGKQTGLARHELINLGRQVQDIGVSLVSGQSPFMVIAQQVPQMADVFMASGKSVGDFFSQATSWAVAFAKTPAGIVTGIAAIGAAAAYTAYQFLKSSTTIEEALERQNNLMKEGIELGKSRDELQFQGTRNLIDLQKKLQEELKKTAALSERRHTSVLQDVGAGLGVIDQPKQAPAYAAYDDAVRRLNEAIANGVGSAKAYGEELSRIGSTYPELAKVVEKMLAMNETSLKLEASLRAAGVSLAQLAALYPGMSVEAAKQALALDNQLKLIQARTAEEKAVVQEKITINRLVLEGLKSDEATLLAAKERLNTEEAITAAKANQVDYAITAYEREQGMTSAVNATQGAASTVTNEIGNAGQAIQQNISYTNQWTRAVKTLSQRWAEITIASEVEGRMAYLNPQFEGTKGEFNVDPLYIGQQKASLERQVAQSGEGRVVAKQHGLAESGFTTYAIEYDKPMAERIQEAAKKAFEDNTAATEDNTAATETMTDVLSPFYSSDPRRTHLGFRSFAGGGIMTAHGELPLKHYQGGGVATSPQVAVYGEGRTPEAYVPVPSGRIPVEIRQPANSNQRPINVTINVMGDADANTVAALKTTAFQQAQAMRRAMR